MGDPDPHTPDPAPHSLPPDRSRIATEARNPGSEALHTLSIEACVRLFNEEDHTVADAVAAAAPAVAAFITAAEPGFLAGGRLIYLGAGTSGRLGVLDASEAPPTFCIPEGRIIGLIAGGDSALRRSSEGLEDDPDGARAALEELGIGARDAVLGIAAGATTPYVLGALRLAKGLGAGAPVTGFLTCSPGDRPEGADHHIVAPVGPELLTGSTRLKAGTATKMILNTISTTLMVRAGRVYRNLMVDVRATNDKLRDRAARIVTLLTGLDRAEAFALLDRAGGAAKTAVVMHQRSLERGEAESLLEEAGGRLDRALGEHQS